MSEREEHIETLEKGVVMMGAASSASSERMSEG